MPTSAEIQCLIIMQAAVASSMGIVVVTNDPYKARAALYDSRKHDPDLATLQIRVSPNDSEHELWIIKRNMMPSLSLSELL